MSAPFKYKSLWPFLDDLELYETWLVPKDKCIELGFHQKIGYAYNRLHQHTNQVRVFHILEGALFVRVK